MNNFICLNMTGRRAPAVHVWETVYLEQIFFLISLNGIRFLSYLKLRAISEESNIEEKCCF